MDIKKIINDISLLNDSDKAILNSYLNKNKISEWDSGLYFSQVNMEKTHDIAETNMRNIIFHDDEHDLNKIIINNVVYLAIMSGFRNNQNKISLPLSQLVTNIIFKMQSIKKCSHWSLNDMSKHIVCSLNNMKSMDIIKLESKINPSKGFGRQWNIIFSEEISKIIQKSTLMLINKPMIIPPSDWQLLNGELIRGGYITHKNRWISSKMKQTNYVKNENKYSEKYCTYINSAQKISIIINYENLIKTLNNLWDLNLAENYEELPYIRDFGIILSETYTQYGIDNYIKNHDSKPIYWSKISNLKFEYNPNNFIESLEKKNLKNQKKINTKDIENIYNLKLVIQNLIILIYILKANKNKIKIYLPIFSDYRGRENTVGVFSYINQKIIRNSISFEKNPPLSERGRAWLNIYLNNIISKPKNYAKLPNIIEKMDHYNEIYKNNFKYINFVENLVTDGALSSNITIQLDASNSLLQIYGLILKNRRLLALCNLYNKENKNISDMYTIIMSKYIRKIWPELKKNIKNSYKIYTLQKIIQERKIWKKWIMETLYGCGVINLYDKIGETLNVWQISYIDGIQLANSVHKYIKNFFWEIIRLNKFIRDFHAKNGDKNINFSDKQNKFSFKICEVKNKNINLGELTGNKSNILSIRVPSDNINRNDTSKSVYINWIHFFDAFICRQVKSALFEKNINVLSIFDAFIIHPNHADTLIEIYNKKIGELIYDNINILESININIESININYTEIFNEINNKIDHLLIKIRGEIPEYEDIIDKMLKYTEIFKSEKKRSEYLDVLANKYNISNIGYELIKEWLKNMTKLRLNTNEHLRMKKELKYFNKKFKKKRDSNTKKIILKSKYSLK